MYLWPSGRVENCIPHPRIWRQQTLFTHVHHMEANIQIRWIANFPVQLNECYVDTMSCIHSNFYGPAPPAHVQSWPHQWTPLAFLATHSLSFHCGMTRKSLMLTVLVISRLTIVYNVYELKSRTFTGRSMKRMSCCIRAEAKTCLEACISGLRSDWLSYVSTFVMTYRPYSSDVTG